MSITQDKIQRDYFDVNMEYDMVTHRFIPKADLLTKVGVNIKTEAYTNTLSKIERHHMADSVYDYMFSHMPSRNQEIVLALIAENSQDEQVTIARAFGAFAHFALRGGDEASLRNGINFETSMFIPPEVMDQCGLGLQVKRILLNGNGKNNSGIWKVGPLRYGVSDVTDLVFGVDY